MPKLPEVLFRHNPDGTTTKVRTGKARRKLPATIELIEYVRIGIPVSHVAEYYGVTESAVYMALRRTPQQVLIGAIPEKLIEKSEFLLTPKPYVNALLSKDGTRQISYSRGLSAESHIKKNRRAVRFEIGTK